MFEVSTQFLPGLIGHFMTMSTHGTIRHGATDVNRARYSPEPALN